MIFFIERVCRVLGATRPVRDDDDPTSLKLITFRGVFVKLICSIITAYERRF